jgi:predicted enzyme related to lactoylglutathione lyase
MKKSIVLILGLVASFLLGYFFKEFSTIKNNIKVDSHKIEVDIKKKKVTGVAGIFFKSKEPKKIKEWYRTHLGLETDAYGARFEWQIGCDTSKKAGLQWTPFSETTTYFSPSTKDFMINYCVENLSDLVVQLKKEGVTIVDTLETYDYGKFIHILDMEGNKIELYEPK